MDQVLQSYRAKIEGGALRPDAAQEALAARLDDLAAELAEGQSKGGGWGRFFGLKGAAPAVRGLYIVGDVGRGKTMLMDLFYAVAPVERKHRVHFHAFMGDVHARIHAWRQASRTGLVRGDDPIAPVAEALAEEARLLCFDEFAVTDIADAMILSRLFTALFAAGVTIVATSNVPPQDLYKDGLNRTLFLPFVALLEERCDMVRLDAAQDFRFRTLTEAAVWFIPADAAAERALDRCFRALTGLDAGPTLDLRFLGRALAVPQASGGVARFRFADLCEAPLGAADYLAIARAFGTVLVDGIRTIGAGERNLAKRFITMVDTFYDEQVKLIASAEVEPDALYQGEAARERFEFQRTVSRLHEMRSADYLALPHGHGRPSGDTSGLVET